MGVEGDEEGGGGGVQDPTRRAGGQLVDQVRW